MLTSDKKICVAMAAGREICLTPVSYTHLTLPTKA